MSVTNKVDNALVCCTEFLVSKMGVRYTDGLPMFGVTPRCQLLLVDERDTSPFFSFFFADVFSRCSTCLLKPRFFFFLPTLPSRDSFGVKRLHFPRKNNTFLFHLFILLSFLQSSLYLFFFYFLFFLLFGRLFSSGQLSTLTFLVVVLCVCLHRCRIQAMQMLIQVSDRCIFPLAVLFLLDFNDSNRPFLSVRFVSRVIFHLIWRVSLGAFRLIKTV